MVSGLTGISRSNGLGSGVGRAVATASDDASANVDGIEKRAVGIESLDVLREPDRFDSSACDACHARPREAYGRGDTEVRPLSGNVR